MTLAQKYLANIFLSTDKLGRKYLVGVSSGSTPTPALDILASVGTSTSPTSTGNKAVTGVGFAPKVVLPFGTFLVTTGANVAAPLGFGAGTSALSRASNGINSRHGVTTTDTLRRHSNNTIVDVPEVNGTPTSFLSADLNALGLDGFTLDWLIANASARILNHICLGGADLEVSLTQHQMNGTNAPQSFAHGLTGGAPTGVLLFAANTDTSPPFTESVLTSGIGAWSTGSQFWCQSYSGNGISTTNTGRSLYTTGVFSLFGTAKTLSRVMSVASVDATNVNVTYPVATITYQSYFYMLAIRGASCQVGTFDCNGSTSPLSIACSGITPKLFLPIFLPGGVDNINTIQNGLELAIGASDGTNNVSCGITDQNGVTTTNARRFQSSTTLAEYNNAGTKVFEGAAAFSGESVVLTPTLNSGTANGQGGYLIIGTPLIPNYVTSGGEFVVSGGHYLTSGV